MIGKMKAVVTIVIACFLIAGFAGTLPVSASPASVTVNAANVIKTIPPYLYGLDVAAWHEMIYWKGTLRTIAVQRLQEAGITWLDYPGGGYSNSFVWNKMNLPSEMNTDQYIALCNAIGATPRISVNLNQPVDLATAWVRYCNIEHNYNVKYWQLHNEPWYEMKGATYSRLVNQFVPAMKAVDPTIKIGVCISCRYPSEQGFTDTVIKNCWQNIDVLNHNAYFIGPGEYTYAQRQAYYDDLLYNTPGELKTWLATLRSIWTKYAGSKPVEYHVGSWNSISYYPADWQINFLPEGLWVADILGTMITDQVDRGCHWCFMNPYPPKQGDYGIISPEFQPYVAHDAHALVAKHFGDTLVSSTSSTTEISAYASTSGGGSKLHILLINKNPTYDNPTTFTLQNFNPQSTATAWILDGPTEPAHVYDYSLRTETISGVAPTFTWTVPSYSAVVIEIPKAGGALGTSAGETTGAGSADVGTTDVVTAGTNLALGKPVTTSSCALKEQCNYYHIEEFNGSKAVDGDGTYTRWASKMYFESTDYPDTNEWFILDFGAITTFNRIIMKWEYHATKYTVYISNDGTTWTKVATNINAIVDKPAPQPIHRIDFATAKSARYIKVVMTGRPSTWGVNAGCSQWTPHAFSFWEFEVYLI